MNSRKKVVAIQGYPLFLEELLPKPSEFFSVCISLQDLLFGLFIL